VPRKTEDRVEDSAFDDPRELPLNLPFYSYEALTSLAFHTLSKAEHPVASSSASDSAVDLWSARFAPDKHSLVVGNENVVEFMYRWLQRWSGNTADDDLVLSFFFFKACYLLSDSFVSQFQEEGQQPKRALLLCGPLGVGKTTGVQVCAKELGYKVIGTLMVFVQSLVRSKQCYVAVTPAQRRSGKEILTLFGEATQSERVSGNFQAAQAEGKSLGSFFASKPKEGKEPPKKKAKLAEPEANEPVLSLLHTAAVVYHSI
jgi:hypothetical protein